MSTLNERPAPGSWRRIIGQRNLIVGAAAATLFLAAACSSGGTEASNEVAQGKVSSAVAAASTSNEDRELAADFELELYGNADHSRGDVVHLSDFAGDPVVLNFWFLSCPPCVAEMPDFETAYQDLKGEGVKFIGVQLLGLDSVEDGQEFVDSVGVNYMLGPDQTADTSGEIIRKYAVIGFPTTVFIDRDQRIARSWSGALNLEKLEELIQEIVN
ncbi:MAG: TlpA disulfide reductase family protein [SAR202 cluster bacterium]|nr:TlpA disulfide reductase family protein [SAR202 cluster bacterium]